MRYVVRNRIGQELVVPSLSDLHGLYAQGFIDDDDEVRQENATRWMRVGKMAALGGVRHRRAEPAKLAMLLAAAVALVAGIALLLLR